MANVLSEQSDKILKLHSIKIWKGVEFYEVNRSLDLTVPVNMTDSEADKLSKEVRALDRALQSKFSEYNNLSRKHARLYQSN